MNLCCVLDTDIVTKLKYYTLHLSRRSHHKVHLVVVLELLDISHDVLEQMLVVGGFLIQDEN